MWTAEIGERLVHQEGWRKPAHELARTYLNKANALKALGDPRAAVAFYDRAIEIYERLVEQEGRRELRGDLAWVQALKAFVLLQLGEHSEASALAHRAIAVLKKRCGAPGERTCSRLWTGRSRP
jgi:tetratricopeptide (TPR) repeat protein